MSQALPVVADLGSVDADFLGQGTPQSWMIGLATASDSGLGILFQTDTDTPVMYDIKVTGLDNIRSLFARSKGFGAAWTFRTQSGSQKVYFSANSGTMVLELDVNTVHLESTTDPLENQGVQYRKGSFKVTKLGVNTEATSNNGHGCLAVAGLTRVIRWDHMQDSRGSSDYTIPYVS